MSQENLRKENAEYGAFKATTKTGFDGPLSTKNDSIEFSEETGNVKILGGGRGSVSVFPGEMVTYQAMANIKKGKRECKKPINVEKVTLSRMENGALKPTAISSTEFNPYTGEHTYTPASLVAKGGEVSFILWDPAITEYTLTMTGTVKCFSQTHTVSPTYTITVKHPEVVLNGPRSQCKAPSYDLNTNSVKVECDVVSQTITGGPNGATYGFLQLAQADTGFKIGGSSSNILKIDKNALDCRKMVNEKCEGVISDIQEGNLQRSFVTQSSVFTAPYSSATNCDYSQLNKVDQYNLDLTYATYFMMRPKDGVWVPLARAKYQPKAEINCNKEKGCGLGLGRESVEKDSYSEPWANPTEKAFDINLDTGWKSKATIPTWSSIFQEHKADKVALAAYFQESTGNSWIMCPNPSFVETMPSFNETFLLESEAQIVADEIREFVEL